LVVFREEDRKEIDRVFSNLNEMVSRRRDLIVELRRMIQKGDQYIKVSGKRLIRVEDGLFVNENQRREFMMEYFNSADYSGYLTELTYILKNIGGLTNNVRNSIIELKLFDNNSFQDVFFKTGDLGKTITAITQNNSKLNNLILKLRRYVLGR